MSEVVVVSMMEVAPSCRFRCRVAISVADLLSAVAVVASVLAKGNAVTEMSVLRGIGSVDVGDFGVVLGLAVSALLMSVILASGWWCLRYLQSWCRF